MDESFRTYSYELCHTRYAEKEKGKEQEKEKKKKGGKNP